MFEKGEKVWIEGKYPCTVTGASSRLLTCEEGNVKLHQVSYLTSTTYPVLNVEPYSFSFSMIIRPMEQITVISDEPIEGTYVGQPKEGNSILNNWLVLKSEKGYHYVNISYVRAIFKKR